jgi:hypothetical protein
LFQLLNITEKGLTIFSGKFRETSRNAVSLLLFCFSFAS